MTRRTAYVVMAAGLAYFALTFAAGFALGVVRVLVVLPRLSPTLGETTAVLLELPVILTIAWWVCRWLVSRFEVPPSAPARLLMGALAFSLLLGAEMVLGALGFGRTASDQLQSFLHLPGFLGLLGQLAFAAFPLIQLTRGA